MVTKPANLSKKLATEASALNELLLWRTFAKEATIIDGEFGYVICTHVCLEHFLAVLSAITLTAPTGLQSYLVPSSGASASSLICAIPSVAPMTKGIGIACAGNL